MSKHNKVKQVLFTFPRWYKTELKTLHTFLPPFTYVRTVEELHEEAIQDSEGKDQPMTHYHSVVILEHPITHAKLKAYMASNFPNDYKRINIQGIKNLKRALSYVIKESTVWLEDGIIPTTAKTKFDPDMKEPIPKYLETKTLYQDFKDAIEVYHREDIEEQYIHMYGFFWWKTGEWLNEAVGHMTDYIRDYHHKTFTRTIL